MANSQLFRWSRTHLIEAFLSLGDYFKDRLSLANLLARFSQFSLGLTIILIPFRYRVVLQQRPTPPLYADYTDFLFFASDLFALTTLLLWGIHLALARKRVKPGPLFLTIPLVALTGLGFVSTLFSLDAPLSLYNAIRLLLVGGLYFYLVNQPWSLRGIFLPVGIQLLIQAVVAVTQFLRQRSLGLTALDEYALDPAWNGVSVVSWGESRLLRAYGLTDHPNILGGCLAFGLLILVTWYLQTSPGWRVPLSGLFALSATALLVTFSRAAWLALGIGFSLFILSLLRTRQFAAIQKLLLLLATGLLVCAPFIWQTTDYLGVRLNWDESFRQVPQETQALGERQLLNRAANEIFVENALSGVGLGASPHALRENYPQLPVYYQPAHFTLLVAAVETGIFGALFYALLMIAPWLMIWLNRKRLDFSLEFIGVSGLLLAVTLVGFFDYYTWLLAPGRLWQWLAWGLWAKVYQASLHSELSERLKILPDLEAKLL